MEEKLIERMLDLSGKVVVITDCTEAWSQNFAKSIFSSGAHLYILGDDQEKLDVLLKKIENSGNTPICGFCVDHTDLDQIVAAKDEIISKDNKIDILINNYILKREVSHTGNYFNSPENYPIDLWQNYIDHNINSVFLATQQFGSVMAKNGEGVILNIVPSESMRGMNNFMYGENNIPPLHYPVAKACIINFTRYLATYWASKGIRVNCLVIGELENDLSKVPKINIEQIPLNKYASEREFNGALTYMISDASTYMTGSIVVVDGGINCI